MISADGSPTIACATTPVTPRSSASSRRTTHLALAAALVFFTPACEHKPPPSSEPVVTLATECVAQRELMERARKKWTTINAAAPAPEAPIEAVAAHTASLGSVAKEIAADFAKSSRKRPEIADSADGVRMLGELAGTRLEAFAKTVKDFGGRIGELQTLERTANGAAQGIDPTLAVSLGCGPHAPDACATVVARLVDVAKPAAPVGFVDGAKMARGRAVALDGLARAVEALPPSPAAQKAREDVVHRARGAATPFNALAKLLDEVAPLQEGMAKVRQDAQSAALRFAQELASADKLCAPDAGAPAPAAASAATAGPSHPPAPGGPVAPAGSGVPHHM